MNGLLKLRCASALKSPNPDTRLRAVEKLASSRSKGVAEHLIAALDDPNPEIRACVIDALANLADPEAIRPLVERLLHETEWAVSNEIALALSGFDPERTTPHLLRGLADEDVYVRQAAASALRRIALDQLNDVHRATVNVVLGEWEAAVACGPAAVEPLSAALLNGTQRGKRCAAESLGEIGTRESYDALVGIVENAEVSEDSRSMAAWALRSFCWPWLDDTHLAQSAILSQNWSDVGSLGPAAVEPLIVALHDGSIDVKRKAAETLSEMGGEDALRALTEALADQTQEEDIHVIAARALADARGTAHTQTLALALDHMRWAVRQIAAAALRQKWWHPTDDTQKALLAIADANYDAVVALGDAALEPLAGAMQHAQACQPAARALARMGSGGVEKLLGILSDETKDQAIQEAAAMALVETGDARAVEPLRFMLRSSDVAVRVSAVLGLQRLGWKPDAGTEEALVAIAEGYWHKLATIGGAAVEPLLKLTDDDMAPVEAAKALREILESAAGTVPLAHLRKLTRPPAADTDSTEPLTGPSREAYLADWATITQLARMELYRRGIFV